MTRYSVAIAANVMHFRNEALFAAAHAAKFLVRPFFIESLPLEILQHMNGKAERHLQQMP